MDYAALANKYGGTAVAPSSPDLSAVAAKYGGTPVAAPTAQPTPVPKEPGALTQFAKSVFSAPATIVARPFQAAAELAGASDTQVNDFTKKIPGVGGLVAPVPENGGDIKKDVGRAVQTVALGTGAPIAGGAIFGAGASLEQGNDLFSTQTAFDTALGAAGGKVIDFVGKPLLNAAGKVVGKITPTILKDVASKGSVAITKFAADHQLLGGIAAKPSAALAKGLQGVDNTIGAGVSKGVSKTVAGLKATAKSQFPGLDPTQHFLDVNAKDIARPTTINKAAYSKATDINSDAVRRGIDLPAQANKLGISHSSITEGGNFNTEDAAQALRQQNFDVSKKVLRPAIQNIETDVQKVPIAQVRGSLLQKIHGAPASQINDAEREMLVKNVNKTYGDDSAAARAHPNGYSLTDLFDSRIEAGPRAKYKPGITPEPDVPKAKLARMEASTFKDIFDRTVPTNSGLDEVRKEFEKNFLLADYLDALHTKKVPEGVVKKAVNIFGRGLGGALGSKVAGFPGFLVGSRGGEMLFHSFELLPSPLKSAVLTRAFADKADPTVFKTLNKYLGDQQTGRLLQKLLPEKASAAKSPTLYTAKKVSTTPIKSEAFDTADVATGKIKAPTTDRRLGSYLKKVQNALVADHQYAPETKIDMGKKPTPKKSPKSLNDIKF